jgi:hypothetical protein
MLTVPIHFICTRFAWLFGIYQPVMSVEQTLYRTQCTFRSITFCFPASILQHVVRDFARDRGKYKNFFWSTATNSKYPAKHYRNFCRTVGNTALPAASVFYSVTPYLTLALAVPPHRGYRKATPSTANVYRSNVPQHMDNYLRREKVGKPALAQHIAL